MENVFSNPIALLVIITIFGIVIIILGIYVLYLISTSTSKGLQKKLEKITLEETKKTLAENKEKTREITDQFLKSWQAQFQETNQILKTKTTDSVNQLMQELSNKFSGKTEVIESSFSGIIEEANNKFSNITEDITNKLSGVDKEITNNFLEIAESTNKKLSLAAEKINNNLSTVTEDVAGKLAGIDQEIENEVSKFRKLSAGIPNLISEEIKKSTQTLSQDLKKEIVDIYKSTEEKLSQEFDEVRKEIKTYKESKFKEVDENIYQILGDIAKKTLGEAIDLSDHEKLVMEALEKAKKENIF